MAIATGSVAVARDMVDVAEDVAEAVAADVVEAVAVDVAADVAAAVVVDVAVAVAGAAPVATVATRLTRLHVGHHIE